MNTPLAHFLSGAIMVVFATISLYFFRFYKETGDKLLAHFALAFLILSVERVFLSLTDGGQEAGSLVYIVRLLAFAVILYGILVKNRAKQTPKLSIRKQSHTG